MKSEKEKMLAGEIYNSQADELIRDRDIVRERVRIYNTTTEKEKDRRSRLLEGILGSCGEGIVMAPNIRFDYGYNTYIGDHFFSNFDCTILDVCEVRIGDNCMLGPGVHIYTATHPLNAAERTAGKEFGKPVTIGNNVWIGGHAVINPGVTIGDNAVVGSGSVVTKDVPANILVCGNPAHKVKEIDN